MRKNPIATKDHCLTIELKNDIEKQIEALREKISLKNQIQGYLVLFRITDLAVDSAAAR